MFVVVFPTVANLGNVPRTSTTDGGRDVVADGDLAGVEINVLLRELIKSLRERSGIDRRPHGSSSGHIETTEGVSVVHADEKFTAFLELDSLCKKRLPTKRRSG